MSRDPKGVQVQLVLAYSRATAGLRFVIRLMSTQALITEFATLGSLHRVLEQMYDEGQHASDALLMRIAMQVEIHGTCLRCVALLGCRCARGWRRLPRKA